MKSASFTGSRDARSEKSNPVRLTRIERPATDPTSSFLAAIMDTAFVIPGTKIRFGLDAVIDLFPGVGDAIGAVIATVMIARASRLGVPKIVLARMAGNVLLNTLVGALPVLGAVLTIFFRSNAMNYALLQKHAGGERKSTAGDWLFVTVLLLGMLAVLGAVAAGGFYLGRALFRGMSAWVG